MILRRQYSEKTMDKLMTMIAVAQLLAEKEKCEDSAKKLRHFSNVGLVLAQRLYTLKKN